MIKNSSKLHIKKLAEFIALQFEEKITPLDKIADDEELRVFYDSFEKDTFDGMTIFDDENFYIYLNIDNGNKLGSERGRFTLAHELGHYFIDAHRVGLKKGLLEPHPSKIGRKQFNEIEREADYFASCLLIPEERFKKDIVKKKFNFELIVFLCKEYKVSRTACAFRFAEIGNHPIMIVYAESGIIKWTHYSDDFPFKYLINDNIVPKDIVMGEYFSKSNVEIFKTEEIWAIDCFKYVKDCDVNRKFYEHCITYKNCALSVIWED
nr:ImmA/IrrE family metallo-endopeptidase [uncultured Flavobacterium sp.]